MKTRLQILVRRDACSPEGRGRLRRFERVIEGPNAPVPSAGMIIDIPSLGVHQFVVGNVIFNGDFDYIAITASVAHPTDVNNEEWPLRNGWSEIRV